MRRIIIDGDEIYNKEKLHRMMKEAFNLPDYYGKNLDALHDCLTEIPGAELQLRNVSKMIEWLGHYGESFIAVLQKIQEERTDFHFKLI